MPQIFQVLRCYKCLVFQVHQAKKSNKWECKLCGEKQSVKRHYGIGTAKDCRYHVQKLNCIRGEINELNYDSADNTLVSDDEENINENWTMQKLNIETPQHSKWSSYIADPEPVAEEIEEEGKPMHFQNAEIVLEIPKKRKKQIANNTNKKLCHIKKSPEKKDTIESLVNTNCLNKSPSKLLTNVLGNINTEKDNPKPIDSYKKFIPSVINKNSKWAQYAENEENIISSVSTNKIISQSCNLFTLSDDTELDDILDI